LPRDATAGSRIYEQAPPPQEDNADVAAKSAPEGSEGSEEKADSAAEAREDASAELLPRLEPRRGGSNYFAVNASDLRPDCATSGSCETGVVQFRVDLEYDIAQFEKWPGVGYFYVVFPMRFLSFWDLFDRLPNSTSSPFIETNYAPGLELSWVLPWGHTRGIGNTTSRIAHEDVDGHSVSIGALHESNGLGFVQATAANQESYSRSWNRLYAATHLVVFKTSRLSLNLDFSAWVPFGGEPIPVWPNGERDGNQLQDHMGYFEAVSHLHLDFGAWLGFSSRLATRQTSADLEVRWSLKRAQVWDGLSVKGNGFRLDLLARCFLGRGERLVVANETHYSCYAGLGL
jgi:hypothetical protein